MSTPYVPPFLLAAMLSHVTGFELDRPTERQPVYVVTPNRSPEKLQRAIEKRARKAARKAQP